LILHEGDRVITMTLDDETLMAYADGELPAEAAARVEKAMAEDEEIAERIAMFTQSRISVRQAFGAQSPVPDALTARIRAMAEADSRQRAGEGATTNVVSLAARRRTVPFWQLPIAASVALAVGVLGGWIGAPQDQAGGGLSIASLDDPALVSALETDQAGARTQIGDRAEVAVIASFLGADGSLCREFEHDSAGRTVVAVACHRDEAWTLEFAVAAAASDASGYAPASSLEALDAWMIATEAGPPLSDAEEAAALDDLR
jgi:anti-sigma-K factor RskA